MTIVSLEVILAFVVGATVHKKMSGNKQRKLLMAALAALVTFVLVRAASTSKEGFSQTEWACPRFFGTDSYPETTSPTRQGGLILGKPGDAAPFFYPPYLLRNAGAYATQEGIGGDNTLTNMYRRVHNLDAIQRAEVFQFNDALAGGSYNTPVEPYIGEAYDRQMMDLKQQIREDIAAKRRPYSEAYDVPTRPLMGDFNSCHFGDCQWDADAAGHILGIPSQVGTRHGYF